jgi:hypothetical protein
MLCVADAHTTNIPSWRNVFGRIYGDSYCRSFNRHHADCHCELVEDDAGVVDLRLCAGVQQYGGKY